MHRGEAAIFLLPEELSYARALESLGVKIERAQLGDALNALPVHAPASKTDPESDSRFLAQHKKFERMVNSDKSLRKLARSAFIAHIRAYSAHPKVSAPLARPSR